MWVYYLLSMNNAAMRRSSLSRLSHSLLQHMNILMLIKTTRAYVITSPWTWGFKGGGDEKCKVTLSELSPSLSLYLSATACIGGTCGAAISSGRFTDVETMPVLRWVQLKTDATPANRMRMCMCVVGRYCQREWEKVWHVMGTNASCATLALICRAPCCCRSERRDAIPDPKGPKACWGAEI